MGNQAYKELWTENFHEKDVQKYDNKFKHRWEKNIKHIEQVAFIRKYIEDWMYWCDCPIGSGRLMRVLQTRKMLGYDTSDPFLEYNRKRGIPCAKGDIFEFGEQFPATFDLVTSLHTIFAFKDYQEILRGFIKSLKPGGVLIVDITNKNHSQKARELKARLVENSTDYHEGMDREEIYQFFGSLDCEVLEVKPHDFWDNYFILGWRHLGGNIIARRLKKYLWKVADLFYFIFKPYRLLNHVEEGQPDYRFTKYLVAVRKR